MLNAVFSWDGRNTGEEAGQRGSLCSFPGHTNWHAKTASTRTSSECSRLMDLRTSTLFHRLLCFPMSTRNSAVRPLFGAADLLLKDHNCWDCCLNVFSSLSDCFAKDKGPWIIKPVASSRGRGIYLVSNVSDQQFSLLNVHIIALISPGFASALHMKQHAANAVRHSQWGLQTQFASHLSHISSCLTCWHHLCCPHRHVLDFPAACPGLSLSIAAHGKPFPSCPVLTLKHRCTWKRLKQQWK